MVFFLQLRDRYKREARRDEQLAGRHRQGSRRDGPGDDQGDRALQPRARHAPTGYCCSH